MTQADKKSRRAGRNFVRFASGGILAISLMTGAPVFAQQAAPTKVSIGYFPGVVQTFLFSVGKERGFFRKNGLDAELVSIASGPNLAVALVTASVQFADVGFSVVGPLISQRQDVLALGGNMRLNYSIIAQPDLKLPNLIAPFPVPIRDLKGKKVGITAVGSVPADFLSRVLKAADMEPTDVQAIGLGGADGIVAGFRAKQVDATVAFPPVAQQIGEEGKAYITVADAASGKNVGTAVQGYMIDMYATMAPWAAGNREATTGFCRAIRESFDWASDPENLPEVSKLLAEWLNLSPSRAAEAWNRYKGTFELALTPVLWDQQGQFAFATGGGDYSTHVDQACFNIFK
jgi:ABC-type nitrate/sulfonate/bicarbonate transport system substrate-binding protein